jgi:hAT family C-terminal dimerisation region
LKKVEELDEDADSRRTVRGPVRYEMQTITGKPHVFTEKERIRSEYYSAVDLLYSEIERRFDQPGLAHMAALEGVLSNTTITEAELVRIIVVYDDIDPMKVVREIRMLPDLLQSQSTQTKPQPKTASEWAIFFASQPETVRHLFRETVKIVQILLVVPATAASAERTFSSLRRLKTWLRRTMTQKRLTHLALLHCHRERTDKCDIEKLCHAFTCKTNERRTTFGF